MLNMAKRWVPKGVTLPELGLYVAALALVGVAVAAGYGNFQSGWRTEQAFHEIMKVKAAAEAYRSASAQGGSFAGISVNVLSDNGYNIEPLDDGDDENTYGLDITLAAAGGGTDATLTYQFDGQADCNQVHDRLDGTTGVKTLPACTSATPSVMTMTIE